MASTSTAPRKSRPYERIAADMRLRIRTGSWRPDQMLPARNMLAEEFGVAPATVSRAISLLDAEGLIRITDRCGTFVAPPPDTEAGPPPSGPASPCPISLTQATVAIVAQVNPGIPPAVDKSHWSFHILHAIEDRLGLTPGIVCRFLNTCPGGEDPDTPAALEALSGPGIDAVVVIDSPLARPILARLEVSGKPGLWVGYDPIHSALPMVYVDNPASGTLAARHLLSQGWRKLAFFQPFEASWAASRLEGARLAAAHASPGVELAVWPASAGTLPEPPLYGRQFDQAVQAAAGLLAAPLAPDTGIIAANDAAAMGFIQAARDHGLAAGHDYGIIGFDDYHRDAHLSSLRPPLEQLGYEAARGIETLLRGEAPPNRVTLRHRLVARDSSRKRGL